MKYNLLCQNLSMTMTCSNQIHLRNPTKCHMKVGGGSQTTIHKALKIIMQLETNDKLLTPGRKRGRPARKLLLFNIAYLKHVKTKLLVPGTIQFWS